MGYQVFAKGVDGQTVTLDLEKTGDETPVTLLYELVSTKVGIPADQIRLIFGGKQLDAAREDRPTIKHWDMSKLSTMHIVLRLIGGASSQAYQVFAKGVDGQTVTLDLEKTGDETPVTLLYELVSTKVGIPADQIRLIFGGKQLDAAREDRPTIKHWDMGKLSTMHIVLRLIGGADAQDAETQECIICLADYPSDAVHFPPATSTCAHEWLVCKSCHADHISAKVTANANYDKSDEIATEGIVTCTQCAKPYEVGDVMRLATRDVFDRWNDKAFKEYARKLPGFRWCCRPGCGFGQDHSAYGQAHVQCSARGKDGTRCAAHLCRGHKTASQLAVPWHEGLSCAEFDALVAEAFSGEKAVSKEVWEALGLKSCPGCACAFQKEGGLDQVTCPRCSLTMCWACLETWKDGVAQHAETCLHHDAVLNVTGRIQTALTVASHMRAPCCGAYANKNRACTHIGADPCPGCGTCGINWCYFCGKLESKLPGGFGAHNYPSRDHTLSVSQCPWFLHDHPRLAAHASDHWVALREFHRWRGIAALHALRNEVGAEHFKAALDAKPALLTGLFGQTEKGVQMAAPTSITLAEVVEYTPLKGL